MRKFGIQYGFLFLSYVEIFEIIFGMVMATEQN